MNPPVFPLAAAHAPLVTLLKTGTGPLRVYQFGLAPQPGTGFYKVPYLVWQYAYGSPENYLGDRPDIDSQGIQIDAYAATDADARKVAEAMRDALELSAHVVSWRGEEVDTETGLSRSSFDVEFWTPR